MSGRKLRDPKNSIRQINRQQWAPKYLYQRHIPGGGGGVGWGLFYLGEKLRGFALHNFFDPVLEKIPADMKSILD